MRIAEICRHDKMVVSDGKPTGACLACSSDRPRNDAFNIPNTEERFNAGLGMVTRGIRHEERIAREKGLVCVGGENLEKYARKIKLESNERKEKEIKEVLDSGMKDIKRAVV